MSQEALADLYREAIRRHAAEPVGFRRPIEATHRHELDNPQCGDRVELRLRVADGVIEDVAFDGEACAICLASASLLCELAPGLDTDRFAALGATLARELATPVGADSSAIGGGFERGFKTRQDQSRMNSLPQGQPAVHPRSEPPVLPEALEPLLGVRPYPSRVGCALLPWKAGQRALEGPPGA